MVCRNFLHKLQYPEWQTKSKLPPCMLRNLGGELGDFWAWWGLVFVWCLVVCCALCSPFHLVSGVQTVFRSENPATSASPASEQSKCNPTGRLFCLGAKQRAKSRGKGELPWDTGMRHFSWLSWRHVTPSATSDEFGRWDREKKWKKVPRL